MTATMVTSAEIAQPARRKSRFSRRIRYMLMLRRKTRAALLLGVLSGALYYLLFLFSSDIRHIAEMTNQGDKTYFLLPIGIAFVFSVVHGLFTDRFWEAMGLTAKR